MRFKTNYTVNKVKPVDCSNVYVKTYVEVLAYTKDKNGKWLNDTSESKFEEGEKLNIQEKIDSYADTCDIYKIIDRYQRSGDEALVNVRKGMFVDITGMPDSSDVLSRLEVAMSQARDKELEAINKEKEAEAQKQAEAEKKDEVEK